MIGREIANYRITEMLGEGGMGVVYKAVDVNLDRPVAIKVLNSDLVRNPELVERFRVEARAQANLNHPNLATLYSFIVHEGTTIMVMEFVDGETLEKMIRRRGPIPSQEAIPLFKQALLGIGYAHRMGIIHRDLKPSNLMLSRNGMVKVMDFGIAKMMGTRGMTRTGTQMGTAFYMSPEQVLNKAVDIRSDIYSLGITLYEMLTGHVPFEAESDYQIMANHVSTPPPLPTRFYPYIPQGVENAVVRAIEKNPDARFQTVEEFGLALEHPEEYVAPVVAVAASPGRTVLEGGTRAAPAPMPQAGATALGSPTTAAPIQGKAPGQPGLFASKNALMAVAGAAVVLVGVLLFATRHKVVPPPPPSAPVPAPVKNTEPPPVTTDQNQNMGADLTIANATPAEQKPARKAPLKRISQTRPQDTATGAPAPVESMQVTTIPAGTPVAVRMIDGIDPQRDHQGQEFHASFDSPVVVGDRVAIPKGADALVEMVDASTAGRLNGRSSLTVKLVQVSVLGHKYPVSSNSYVEQGPSRGRRGAEVIGGAAAVGSAIGGFFGHKKKKNAAVGAAAGTGADTGVQELTDAQEVNIASETVIRFVLDRPLELPQPQ
jgi:serine/threonine-protein kinase